MRLDITVEAALHFRRGLLSGESQLDFHIHLRESLHQLGVRHLRARRRIELVAVGPRVHPHLGAREVHAVCRTIGDRDALTVLVNGDRGLMTVLDGPDDVERTPRRIAAEKHTSPRTFHRCLVNDGHLPLVELDADIALDPRERIVLPDRENHFVARKNHTVDDGARLSAVCLGPFDTLEFHADEFAVLDHEPFWRVILDDVNAFFFRVFKLPRRCLEVGARATGNDFRIDATQSA